MVLLILKLFVSSHPLELWRSPMHLCFATPWGTSWIPLCYVFYMLQTNIHFSMHYYSWSFVCVSFHVVTWLLSSMVTIISLMPMFRVLWSQHAMSRLCWCMSPQKLLFYYHLPTRGRAWVKLGDAWYVSNVSIIFDAPCLFYTNCFVFVYTSWHFYAFSRTNLLMRW
jgi:hypothetical protein